MEDTNKRLLLAFGLAFIILILWRTFLLPPEPPPKQAPKSEPAASAPLVPPGKTEPVPGTKPSGAAAPAALPVQQGTKAEQIVVEGDLYRVTLSTRGGTINSWVLKKYRDAKEQPLDVVDDAACEHLGFPMSLSLADQALSDKVNTALFVAAPTGGTLQAPVKIALAYSDGKVQVKKEFSFEPGYQVHVTVSVFDGQNYLPVQVAWPGGFGDSSVPAKLAALMAQSFYRTADSSSLHTETLTPSWFGRISGSSQKPQDLTVTGPLAFAGLEDRYFAGTLLPDSPDVSFHVDRQTWTPVDWKGQDKDKPNPLRAVLAGTTAKPLGFRLVVVPKDLDVLRAITPPLDDVVDFGWFSLIAKPLFLGLRYIYDHWAHNWGWAIVILTLLINFALFPLKLKSIRSAQEMQKVAPIIKGIQDKYKQYKFNDPRKQKMNQEVMKVYSEHGINPLGGCVPMLLQFPILLGFYRLLSAAIELRHAPWVGCVHDLSVPDSCHLFGIPLAVLPTIMVVTSFVLQKMTPMATADPAQKRMMFLMPLMFGVIFYSLASGLVLYYLTANLVGIAQQVIINRFVPSPQKAPQDPTGGGRSKSQARKAIIVKE